MASCEECFGSVATVDGPYWIWMRNSSQLCVQNLSRWGQKFIRAIDTIDDCPSKPINYGITVGIPVSVLVAIGLAVGGALLYRRYGRLGSCLERQELLNRGRHERLKEIVQGSTSFSNPLYGMNEDALPQPPPPPHFELPQQQQQQQPEPQQQQQPESQQQQQQPEPQQKQQIKIEAEDATAESSVQSQQQQQQLQQVKCEAVALDYSFENEEDAINYPHGPFQIFVKEELDQNYWNSFASAETEDDEIEIERALK